MVNVYKAGIASYIGTRLKVRQVQCLVSYYIQLTFGNRLNFHE